MNPVFIQFAFFSILFSVLLGISSIEYIIVKRSNSDYENFPTKIDYKIREYRYRHACTWAFWGLLLCALIAVFGEEFDFITRIDKWTFSIPISFICLWATNHMIASVALNITETKNEYEFHLSEAILAILTKSQDPTQFKSVTIIYSKIKNVPGYPSLNAVTFASLKTISLLYKPVGHLLKQLKEISCTIEKVESILAKLENDGEIEGSLSEGYRVSQKKNT